MKGRTEKEHRWCDLHHYFIDIDACEARAHQNPRCRRCLRQSRQLCLPLPELFQTPILPRGGTRNRKNKPAARELAQTHRGAAP